LKLALRPTVPARERFYANPRPARRGNAPLRQTGSTVGQCSGRGFRRERCGSRSGGRAGELGDDREGRHGAGPDPGHEREAVPAPIHASSSSASAPMRRPRAQAWARRRRPVSVRCRRSATDAVSRRGFWRYRRVASPFVRGPARSAAAPLKRESCESGYAVSANVTHSDVFLHARCLVGASRGWAGGRRGATRHREFAHAHAF
jgi:hypothetical protein